MSAARTPGPWRWEGSALRAGSSLRGAELEIVLWTSNAIGSSTSCAERLGACGKHTELAAEANARLIAAAPDLLDALSAMLEYTAELNANQGMGDDHPAVNQASAAVAKATGGAA